MSFAWLLAYASLVCPQEPAPEPSATQEPAAEQAEPTPEEIDALFQWQSGEIALGGGIARLVLPPEYRYLDPAQAKTVLERVWGNPPSELTLGMIFPVDKPIVSDDGWGVVLRFEECGYVSDEDAHEIDYAELLADIQSATHDENAEREKAGFGTLEIVGWAAHPSYDGAQHKLLWAKELQFSDAPVRTLNYDLRVLGRKGVLSMNAIAAMQELAVVEQGMNALSAAVQFAEGNRYEDFDSSLDEVAAFGIGGLIAGQLALKAGLFKGLLALLIAGKKLVIVACAGIGAFFVKRFKRKKAEQPA